MGTVNQRLQALRHEMQAQQIDCLALVPGHGLRYLTGIEFMLCMRPFVAFLPADSAVAPVLVIPELEAPAWEEAAPFEVRILPCKDKDGPGNAMRQAAQALAAVRIPRVVQASRHDYRDGGDRRGPRPCPGSPYV